MFAQAKRSMADKSHKRGGDAQVYTFHPPNLNKQQADQWAKTKAEELVPSLLPRRGPARRVDRAVRAPFVPGHLVAALQGTLFVSGRLRRRAKRLERSKPRRRPGGRLETDPRLMSLFVSARRVPHQ